MGVGRRKRTRRGMDGWIFGGGEKGSLLILSALDSFGGGEGLDIYHIYLHHTVFSVAVFSKVFSCPQTSTPQEEGWSLSGTKYLSSGFHSPLHFYSSPLVKEL